MIGETPYRPMACDFRGAATSRLAVPSAYECALRAEARGHAGFMLHRAARRCLTYASAADVECGPRGVPRGWAAFADVHPFLT